MIRMVLALGALLVTTTAQAQYDGAVFRQVDQCAYECSMRCENMLAELERRIQRARGGCHAQRPIDQDLFQEAYNWAYGSNGLNLMSTEAREFAQQIADMPNGRRALPVFQSAYAWAYSSSGLNLMTTASREWAWAMVRQPNPDQALSCYKQAYAFAYSPSGLNLMTAAAREHAERTCRIR